jgi:hypothetical protein
MANFSDISGRYRHGRTVLGEPTFGAGQVGRAGSFDGDTEVSFGNVGRFDRGDAFSSAVWLKGRGNLPVSVFQKVDNATVAMDSSGCSTTSHSSAFRDGRPGFPCASRVISGSGDRDSDARTAPLR